MKLKEYHHLHFRLEELNDLIVSSKNGDTAAFEQLSQIVRQIAMSYFVSKHRLGKIHREEDIEDLAHNIYLTFHEQFQNIQNLEKWLRRVLFLTFVNYYKKNNLFRFYDIEIALSKKSVVQEYGNSIDIQKILLIIKTFSSDKQKIIKMRIWDDLQFSDIANALGKNEDAVKKMFYRAIKEIHEQL